MHQATTENAIALDRVPEQSGCRGEHGITKLARALIRRFHSLHPMVLQLLYHVNGEAGSELSLVAVGSEFEVAQCLHQLLLVAREEKRVYVGVDGLALCWHRRRRRSRSAVR